MTREELIMAIIEKLVKLGFVEIIPEPPEGEKLCENVAAALTK